MNAVKELHVTCWVHTRGRCMVLVNAKTAVVVQDSSLFKFSTLELTELQCFHVCQFDTGLKFLLICACVSQPWGWFCSCSRDGFTYNKRRRVIVLPSCCIVLLFVCGCADTGSSVGAFWGKNSSAGFLFHCWVTLMSQWGSGQTLEKRSTGKWEKNLRLNLMSPEQSLHGASIFRWWRRIRYLCESFYYLFCSFLLFASIFNHIHFNLQQFVLLC